MISWACLRHADLKADGFVDRILPYIPDEPDGDWTEDEISDDLLPGVLRVFEAIDAHHGRRRGLW